MTIADTIADRHYGDKVKMAFAFAELLNQEALALEKDGVDVVQFDEPAFNVFMGEVTEWGIAALERAAAGPQVHHRRAHLLRLRHQGQHRLEGDAGRRVAPVRGDLPGHRQEQDRAGVGRVPQLQGAAEPAALLEGKDILVGAIDVASDEVETPEQVAAVAAEAAKHVPRERIQLCTNCGMAPMRRDIAYAKLAALAKGAELARSRAQ